MTGTKTVKLNTKDGREVEITITKKVEVRDRIVNADGDMMNMGRETVNSLYIEMKVEGEYKDHSDEKPEIITPVSYGKHYDQMKAAGVHGRLGDTYISEKMYDAIITAIEELETDLDGGSEYAAVKAVEVAKELAQEDMERAEAARYEQSVKNGLCSKCGTYCWGDCEAS